MNFDEVERRKLPLLYEAAAHFLDHGAHDPRFAKHWKLFGAFCKAEVNWLNDYAMYAVLRREYRTGAWTAWPEPVRKRQSKAMADLRAKHARALAIEQVLQFAFDRQWHDLRSAAARAGIRILGDIAIFVNMDSSDVWTHPELFELDEELRPIHVAGVPPDYFSATGQRWGNPLYRWDVLARQGFDWWVQRIARSCQLYDIVRLDHFRGFESYWSIPADEETAIHGEWIKAPGLELFRALEAQLGELPLVAEDLGLITKAVDKLRLDLGMPGMRVIQFGFSDKGATFISRTGMCPRPWPTPAPTITTRRWAGGRRPARWSAPPPSRMWARSTSTRAPYGPSSGLRRPASPNWPSSLRRICSSLAPRPA